MRKDVFSGYHPAINFAFLCIAVFFSLMVQHPLWILVSIAAAGGYAVLLGGRKAVRFMLTFTLPIILLTALLNPIFVHQGATILGYLGDNPVTLEAFIYGMTRGLMFGAGILWFYCYQHLMTGDKFMYLFGKAAPAGSLIFSMVLSFIPRFHARLKIVSDAQKSMGKDVSQSGVAEKLKNGILILSIMTTWSLENAIDTSDSMKSRGYGLKNRSSYKPYRLDRRDALAGTAMGLLALLALAATILGFNAFRCYPTVMTNPASLAGGMFLAGYALFAFSPVLLNIAEALKWKHIQSEI